MEKVRTAVGAEKYEAIFDALAVELGCNRTPILLTQNVKAKKVKGEAQRWKVHLYMAYCPAFVAFLQEHKLNGAWYFPKARTWSVPQDLMSTPEAETVLARNFQYVVDVSAGRIFGSKAFDRDLSDLALIELVPDERLLVAGDIIRSINAQLEEDGLFNFRLFDGTDYQDVHEDAQIGTRLPFLLGMFRVDPEDRSPESFIWDVQRCEVGPSGYITHSPQRVPERGTNYARLRDTCLHHGIKAFRVVKESDG